MPKSNSNPRLNARQRHIQSLVQLAIDFSELEERDWQRKYSFPKPRILRDAVLAWELTHDKVKGPNSRSAKRAVDLALRDAPWRRKRS